MKLEKVNWVAALAALVISFSAAVLPGSLYAQQTGSQQEPAQGEFKYSEGPSIFGAYSYPNVPRPSLANSPALNQLIQNDKLELSLDSAIQLALQNNLDINVARYELPLARLDILRAKSGGATRGVQGSFISQALFAGALGATSNANLGGGGTGGGGFQGGGVTETNFVGCCDAFTGFSFGWNNASTPLNFESLTGVPIEGSHTASYSTFFGKGWLTGTSFLAAVSGQRNSTTSTSALFNPSIPTTLTVGLNQHLLNGFGRRANAVFIRIARNNMNVADSVFRQQVIITISAVLNAYYTLLADRDQVRVAQSAVDYSQKLVEDDKKQVQIGTLAPLDVVQAESELASDQQQLIVAQTTYLQQQEVIKTLISKRVTPTLASVQLDATDNLPEPKPGDIPPLQEALATAVKKRPEIEQDRLNLRNQDFTIQSNRNGLLPTLDAFATYQSNGLAGVPFVGLATAGPGGLGDSLGQVFGGKYPSYSVGLTFRVPIHNRNQQANAAQAVVELHRMQASMQRDENTIEQSVRNAEIAVTQAKAQIEAAIKARDYAQQALDAENKKLRLGVSTTLNVILLQRDLITAEGNLAKARQAYAQSLVQYHQATGTILDAHNVVLTNPGQGVYTREKNIPGAPAIPAGQP
ncbi:MAG TPA: TolC family protein [Terriglobia bacterium]|nr:TolC family protein [Terriglobia bacterium]